MRFGVQGGATLDSTEALPDLALAPIVSGRYRDRFERHYGHGRFVERRVHTDLVGDGSHHLRHAPGERSRRRCSPDHLAGPG